MTSFSSSTCSPLAAGTGGVPELLVVGSFPGKPSFRGLGEQTADELETLWPSRAAAAALPEPGAAAATPVAAVRAAQDLEAAPFLGDTWFFRRAGTHADPQRRARPRTEGRPYKTPTAPA